jgi:rare lipoprotein A
VSRARLSWERRLHSQAAASERRVLGLAACLALLSGCSLLSRPHPVRQGPPERVEAVPDAVPRAEPRSALGNPPYYDALGHRYYVMASAQGYVETGVASWYGPGFQQKDTSSGEPYDMYGMTAAHKTLPLPTYARVTNLANGRSVVVRINDRGPFVANRIIDLTYTAAARLDMLRNGTAVVEVRAIMPGEAPGALPPQLTASQPQPPRVLPLTATLPPVDSPRPAAVLTEQPPAAAHPPGLASPPVKSLYLQAGAFADPRNAQAVLARLRDGGIPGAFLLEPPAGSALFRVRMGPLSSVEDIDHWVERLAALGFGDARIVTAE